MLDKDVLAGLNKQIQQEFTASYGYLALSVYFEEQILKGFAAYFRKQMGEEQEHATKILEYVQDRGGQVTLGQITPPSKPFKSIVDALKFALEAERNNTASINALYELAVKKDDLATQAHLQWFINEQVEEEKWAEEFVALGQKFADHPGSMFMLDHRVSKLAEKDED